MNPESKQSQLQQNLDIIASLSSNENYFLVYPFSKSDSFRVKNLDNQVPNVIVFKPKNQLRFKELFQNYRIQFGRKLSGFQLTDGTFFGTQDTLYNLKKWLRTQKIDGITFYSYVQQEDELYSNECCVLEVIENQTIQVEGVRKIHFEIQPINYSVYIDCWNNEKMKDLRQKLALEIDRIWGKKIPSDWIELQNQEKIRWLLQSQKVKVKIKGTQLPFPRENRAFLTIKGSNDIILQNIRKEYSAVESKKVVDLLKEIDKQRDWKEFGLKIGDIVVKSNEVISEKCQRFFETSTTNIRNLVGVVIKQVHIFQNQKSKIEENSNFNLQTILVPTQQNSTVRDRCNQQILKRAEQSSHQYFKGNFKNVEPILLYTSQLKVRPSSIGKRQSSLFRVVNEHLRTQNFAETKEEDYLKWQYQYQCILLNKLSKLQPLSPDPKQPIPQNLQEGWTNRVLWRGQGHLHQFEENEIVTFKQFISTTEKEGVAKGLASQCLLKITKSKSGRFIQDYSLFKTEAEVLFTSYTNFKVVKKYMVFNEKKKKDMVCFQMEQLAVLPPPPPHANFVLWVDDKTVEGKKMWDQFSSFENSTILIQLVSTQELQKWLKVNESIIKNHKEAANVSMISNMTRKEKGKDNGFAGVDAIKAFRKYLPNGSIFLYIGNRKLALQKLQKNGISPSEQLRVSSIPQQLKNFLKSNIKIL